MPGTLSSSSRYTSGAGRAGAVGAGCAGPSPFLASYVGFLAMGRCSGISTDMDPDMPGGPPQEGDAWRAARGHCKARLSEASCARKIETVPGRLLWCVARVRDSCSSCPHLAGEGAFRNPNSAGPQSGHEEIITTFNDPLKSAVAADT